MTLPDDPWWLEFIAADPPHTAKLATVRADGRPHVAPVWVALDGRELLFNTGADTLKGHGLRRDPRVSLSFDDERPPFSFVIVEGTVELFDDLAQVRRWVDHDRRPLHGCRGLRRGVRDRNGVPGELLVRVTPTHVVRPGHRDIAELGGSFLACSLGLRPSGRRRWRSARVVVLKNRAMASWASGSWLELAMRSMERRPSAGRGRPGRRTPALPRPFDTALPRLARVGPGRARPRRSSSGGDDAVDQPPVERGGRVDPVAGEGHLERPLATDAPGHGDQRRVAEPAALRRRGWRRPRRLAATARSHEHTSWHPAAVARACTSATTGWGIAWMVVISSVHTSSRPRTRRPGRRRRRRRSRGPR